MAKQISAHQRITEELKRRAAQMRAGERFITERELCAEFGVSRMTANQALKALESKGWLRRARGSGTFVDKPNNDKPLKFLLPCPEYMVYDCTYPLRLALYGAERAAANWGRKVEGVWVSPSNSPDDIDWRQFDGFDERTEVLVYTRWFKSTFERLRELGCRTVLVSPDPADAALAPDTWGSVSVDLAGGMAGAVAHLLSAGRRRAAFIYHYPENNHPLKLAFEAALGDNLDPRLLLQAEFPDSLERAVGKLLAAGGFDALLLSRPEFAGTTARLLRNANVDAALMVIGDDEWLVRQDPPVSALGIPHVQMGREAVNRLLGIGPLAGRLLLAPRLTLRESSCPGAGAPVSPDCFPPPPSQENAF